MAVQPHEKGSVLITTHLHFEEWVHVFGHTQMTQTLIVTVNSPRLVLGTGNKRGRLKKRKKNKTGRTQLNNRVSWTHGGRWHFSTELYSERFDQHQVAGLVKRMRPLGAVMPSSLASYEFRTKSSLPSISLFW